MNKRILPVAALAIFSFASCFKTDGGTNTPRAGVMIDLLSPNATSTNIILNGNVIGSNISYGSTPQYYNQVDAGSTSLGVTSTASAYTLNATIATEPGKFYSTFLVDSANKMKAITVIDSVDYPGSTDSVKVRFFNFAVNSPAVSLWIDSASIWPNRAFENQSTAIGNNSFKDLKAGIYNFKIKSPDSGTTFADTTISFEGKHIYTLFIKGFFTDTTGAAKLGLGTVRHG